MNQQPSSGTLDVTDAIRGYAQKIVSGVGTVKALLLDDHTLEILSVVYSQSEILKNDVFLLDKLKNQKREKLPHIPCCIFIRPDDDNVELLKKELALDPPKYKDYRLYFSNIVSNHVLDPIASADKKQLIKEVFEYYADYIAVDRHMFTLNFATSVPLYKLKKKQSNSEFERMVEGVLSCMLSLKKRPIVRYQANSVVAKELASEVTSRIDQESTLFSFNQRSAPLLLILDRRDDPITPLLTQWTYQAMVHELLGIRNNRVLLSNSEDEKVEETIDIEEKGKKDEEKKKQKEIVLSSIHDSFYAENIHKNWGDLCSNIKSMVDKYNQKTNVKSNAANVDEIFKVVSELPEFKKMAGEVEKHVTLVHEIKKVINNRDLLNVSKLEQEMVCSDNHSEHVTELKNILADMNSSKEDALRLVLLYALKYENSTKSELKKLFDMLVDQKDFTKDELDIIKTTLAECGNAARTPGLFGEQGTFKSFLREIVTGGMKEEKNVFTQHKPLLQKTLDALLKGKLSDKTYPFINLTSKDIPKEVIVFIVGGTTYEELLCIDTEFNTGGKSVIIGGTQVLNSKDFINELRKLGESVDDLV